MVGSYFSSQRDCFGGGRFLVFRLLDIGKPFFIGWIDKNVHGGLGVMADDLVAGAVTSLLLLLAVYFITS